MKDSRAVPSDVDKAGLYKTLNGFSRFLRTLLFSKSNAGERQVFDKGLRLLREVGRVTLYLPRVIAGARFRSSTLCSGGANRCILVGGGDLDRLHFYPGSLNRLNGGLGSSLLPLILRRACLCSRSLRRQVLDLAYLLALRWKVQRCVPKIRRRVKRLDWRRRS